MESRMDRPLGPSENDRPQPKGGSPARSGPAGPTAVTPVQPDPSEEQPGPPRTYCLHCKEVVAPVGRGQCPTCGRALPGSALRTKAAVDKKRLQQLYHEAVTEYGPTTLEARDACHFLARVKERLDHTRLGTPEHQRLMQMW